MRSKRWFHEKRALFIVTVAGGLMLSNECSRPENSKIEVVASSLEGDRLTPLECNHFNSLKAPDFPEIQVDEHIRFQRISGFGASFNEAGMICLNTLQSEAREDVLKMLFDKETGAGFTAMKSPIGACDFASSGPWYSYNDTPGDTAMENFTIERDLSPNGLVNYIHEASKFGAFEIETTMDFAPDWMYYSLQPGEKHIKPGYYKALAKYYSKYLKAYSDNGITIQYLNLFNEAHNPWYSNVTYEVIGELIKNYVVPQLRADGVSVKIQLGETANRPEALEKFPVVLSDPDIRKQIHSLTVHGYDWDQFSALTELHNMYPDLPIWQTEVCYARVGDKPTNEPPDRPLPLPVYEFDDGEYWGNMIMNDLKNWASAWIYWNMILDQDGGPWLISGEHGDHDNNRQQPVVIINRNTAEVTYTGLYYYLAHFSRFIRPGAYRIQTGGGSPSLNVAGFINPDGSMVLNIINNGDETDCKIAWNNRMAVQKLMAHSITTLKWNGTSAKED